MSLNCPLTFGVPLKMVIYDGNMSLFQQYFLTIRKINYIYTHVGFGVFIAVTMKNAVCWDEAPCGSVSYY
jgi:hypothetical protein